MIQHKTTPFDIAMGISKGLANNSVVALANGTVIPFGLLNRFKVQLWAQCRRSDARGLQAWDMQRPLVEDTALELCKFDHPAGRETFWHSRSGPATRPRPH
jgi:threonyl-tRNA synthetase